MGELWLSLAFALIGLGGLFLLLRPVRRSAARKVVGEGRFATLTKTPMVPDQAEEGKETEPPSG